MNEDTSLAVIAQSFLKSSPLFQKKELQLNEGHVRAAPPPIPKKKPQRTKDNGLKQHSEGKEAVPVKKNGLFWMKKSGPAVKPYQGIMGMKLGFHSPPQGHKKLPSPVKSPPQPRQRSIFYQVTNGHNPPVTRSSKLEQIMQSKQQQQQQSKQQLLSKTEEGNKIKGRPLPQVPKLALSSNRESVPYTYSYPDFTFSSKKHNSHPPAIEPTAASGKNRIERANSAGSIRQASSEPQLPKTASSPLAPRNAIIKSVSSADLLKGSTPLLQFESVDDDEYFQLVDRVKPYSITPFSIPTDDQQKQDQKSKKEVDDDDDDDDSYVEMHPSPSGYTYIDSQPAPAPLDDEEGEYQYVDMNRSFYPASSPSGPPKVLGKYPFTKRNSSTQQLVSPMKNVTRHLGSNGDEDGIYY